MQNTILIVDDIELNRDMLSEILEDDFTILEAVDGKDALIKIEQHYNELCAILLDLVMPELDGFGVLETMRSRGLTGHVPVLIISGERAIAIEKRCFEYDISDFIRKPFDSALVHRRVKNAADLFVYKNHLEETVLEQTRELQEQNKRLKKSYTDIIDILGTVVEARNLESGEHVKRVKGFTRVLAEEMAKRYPEYGLTPERIDVIVSASSLHDIGKIMIKDSVLLKPGRFTPEEFSYMKTHTTCGCEILKNIVGVWDDEYEKTSYNICRYHHERYDGRGYPDGLADDTIPIEAQLVSVADVYDALVTERVYKKAFTKEQAFNMILNHECGVFSPKLMEAFKASRERFEALASATDGMPAA